MAKIASSSQLSPEPIRLPQDAGTRELPKLLGSLAARIAAVVNGVEDTRRALRRRRYSVLFD